MQRFVIKRISEPSIGITNRAGQDTESRLWKLFSSRDFAHSWIAATLPEIADDLELVKSEEHSRPEQAELE